jgi:sigma-B regulation protein RsbU (phosphoserine phosphatase)
LNDTPVRGRIELHDGDELRFCDYHFQFLTESSSAIPSSVRLPGGRGAAIPSRTKETLASDDEQPLVPLLDADHPLKEGEGSSILSRVPTDHVQTVRLNVRPEVKLKAIVDLCTELGTVLKIDDVLPSILTALFRIFPQADHGLVMLKNPATERLNVRASKSRKADDDENIPLSMTIIRQALDSRQAILSADATRDHRFTASESLTDLQIRSVMCAPLVDPSREGLGVIQVSTRDLSQQFTPDDLELLASVTSQCALAVQNAALHESLLAQRDMDRELEFATQVQLGFLPNEPPQAAGYAFDDYYEPAHRVGGDYFDYIRLPNGNIAVTIGDVAGKGVPAALLMARLHASARYHLLSATSASEALTSLNSEMVSSGLGFRFITLALAILNPTKHELVIANAGHLPPYLRDATGCVIALGQKQSGMPLGVSLTQSFQQITVSLAPGDTVVFFTDGVTEAMNPALEIYGRQRLSQTIATGPAEIGKLVPAIVDDVEGFFESRTQRDDLCIVGVQRLVELAESPTAVPAN